MRKQERRQESKEKGITLVALVITIIVLLILAGVTISMVVGDNGIIQKAKDAKQNMSNAAAEEQQWLAEVANKMNEIEGGSGGIVTPPEPLPDPTDPENWNPEKVKDVVTEVVEEEELHAPIPDGFTASKVDGENTISSGLVIYETEEEVNSSNHDTALTTYNQYVWIPVTEINDMVMCKNKTTDTQCHIIRVDDEASPNGFYLKCETHDSTDLAGKLYDVTKTAGGQGTTPMTYEMDANQTDQAYNDDYREPAIVTGSSTGDGTEYDGDSSNFQDHGIEVSNAQEFLTQLNNDFNNMVKSVYTYGGFYVGRYEMGAGGSTKKGQTVLTASSNSGNMWYGFYNTARVKGEATNREMIWRMPVRPSYPIHWRTSPNSPFR